MTVRDDTLSDRLRSRIDTSGGPDACHPWLAGTDPSGYGRLRARGENSLAHRVAYELLVGPIPDGLSILHECDNPPCCNPRHLYPGTQQQNVVDMVARGRSHRGVKLTVDLVVAIRRLRGSSTQERIAARFGISRAMVSLIHSGRRHGRVAL